MRLTLAVFCSIGLSVRGASQSPRVANPERPTFATHAYAVAPGYVELEQGIRAQGQERLSELTAWDLNCKVGLDRHLQLGLFGPGALRTASGTGVGDWGIALKVRGDLSTHVAIAVEPSVTLPTGDAAAGRGGGKTTGAVLAVVSADLPDAVHVDVNLGPTGVGPAAPQWFHSVAAAYGPGRYGVTAEIYGYTAAAGVSAEWGVLGAAEVRVVEWAVVDAGGSVGIAGPTPELVFVGLTTNVGRIFK